MGDSVIIVNAGCVRKLGGPRLADAMDAGQFPAEMPFATSGTDPGQVN
jgi:hypothetical protein